MRGFLTRAWNAFCIKYGFKESPKHFEGFVWHRYPDLPKVPAHPPLISARELAQRRCKLQRVELIPAVDCIPTGPVSREQTEKYKALPRWLKE